MMSMVGERRDAMGPGRACQPFLVHHGFCKPGVEARLALFDFVDDWYNTRGRHSSIDPATRRIETPWWLVREVMRALLRPL